MIPGQMCSTGLGRMDRWWIHCVCLHDCITGHARAHFSHTLLMSTCRPHVLHRFRPVSMVRYIVCVYTITIDNTIGHIEDDTLVLYGGKGQLCQTNPHPHTEKLLARACPIMLRIFTTFILTLIGLYVLAFVHL